MGRQKEKPPISRDDCVFFNEFIQKYEKFILYIAKQYDCPEIPLDDIQQEAMIRLMLKIPVLRRLGHHKTCSYISHTVKSAFLDLLRSEKRNAYVSMDSSLEEMVGTERDLVPDLFIRQELQRLRTQLPAREWLALKGKYVFGYSQEELGQQLDMAPDSVRMFLFRARKLSMQILSAEKVTGGGGDD